MRCLRCPFACTLSTGLNLEPETLNPKAWNQGSFRYPQSKVHPHLSRSPGTEGGSSFALLVFTTSAHFGSSKRPRVAHAMCCGGRCPCRALALEVLGECLDELLRLNVLYGHDLAALLRKDAALPGQSSLHFRAP